jgi:serine/threonine-protein kinase
MSPEQVQGKEVDPRTDIYSLGVTAYHMFTGQPPFRGQSAFDVAMQHVQGQATPLKEVRPDLPIELCQMVEKMMAKDPAQRYQTARELLRDLSHLREGLAGKTALKTQQFAVSQAQPATMIPAPPPPSMVRPVARPPRRWWLIAAVAASLLLAFAVGLFIRLRADRPRGSDGIATETDRRAEPDPREAFLQDEIRKSANRNEADHFQRHLQATAQLGVLYLEQRRLKEADAYFRALRDKSSGPGSRLYHALGRIGEAAVLAFQEQAAKSLAKFQELAEAPRPGDKEIPKGRLPGKLLNNFPDYFMLRWSLLRPVIVEALDHNAANIAPQKLPAVVDDLRQLPAAPLKP